LNGDNTYDRVETYNYFPTNDVVGYELYTQSQGQSSATGTFANMTNGQVKLELWTVFSNNTALIRTSATVADTQQSKITIPYIPVVPTATPTVTATNISTMTATATIELTATVTATVELTATASPSGTSTQTVTKTPTKITTSTATKTATKTPVTVKLNSIGAQDGILLESSETSNIGGMLNTTSATFNLGDNADKKQYRGVLSSTLAACPITPSSAQ